jgi:sucrose-6-phosphate hydrolase SacC (GH32 family)
MNNTTRIRIARRIVCSTAIAWSTAVATFGVDAVFAADVPTKMEIKETETPKMPDPLPEGWVTYHLAHPGPGRAYPGDPNAAIHHQGRYHVHYIYDHGGFAFGHWSSTDMVYWKWHPTVLKKGNTGHGMFSGTAFRTLDDRVAIIYHGQGSGRNQLAFALDDNLDSWTQPQPIIPLAADGTEPKMRHWDPDCWLIGDTYHALSGGGDPQMITSKDLKKWIHVGPVFHKDFPDDIGTNPGQDVSCANMFKLGDRWMLLCICHDQGARYFLGDFEDGKYLPTHHGAMNWVHRDVFAPESLLTPDGRRVMWAWCLLNNSGSQKLEGRDFSALEKRQPTGIQTLPRELSLCKEGTLEIRPLRELEKLRTTPTTMTEVTVKDGQNMMLKDIAGDTIELEVIFAAPQAAEFGLNVLCDKEGNNGVKIASGKDAETLTVGYNNRAPFKLSRDEDLTLRVFIDKCMVEVFANNRQAVLIWDDNDPSQLGISLFAKAWRVAGQTDQCVSAHERGGMP